MCGQSDEYLRHLLRRKELAARLAGIGGIHRHQEFVGVAKGVVLVVLQVLRQLHVAHRHNHVGQHLVAVANAGTKLGVVHDEVAEEALHLFLRIRSHGTCLNGTEGLGERLVEVLVGFRLCRHIAEQLAGQDEEPLLGHQLLPGLFGTFIRKGCIVESFLVGLLLHPVDVHCQVLADVAVENRPQDVCLEVPTVHLSSEFVGDVPDCSVQFITLASCCHVTYIDFC